MFCVAFAREMSAWFANRDYTQHRRVISRCHYWWLFMKRISNILSNLVLVVLTTFVMGSMAQSQTPALELLVEMDLPAFEGAAAVAIHNNHLLAVDDNSPYDLRVWDISSPSTPVLVRQIEVNRALRPNDMLIHNNMLYISGSGNQFNTDTTLDVWDVSQPADPSLVRSYASFSWNGNTKRITALPAARNGELMAKVGTFDLARLDIQDPGNITIKGGFGDSFGQSLIGGIGTFQFVSDTSGWLDNDDIRFLTFSASGTVSATSKSNLTGELYDFVVFSSGQLGFSVNWTTGPLWLATLDTSNPNNVVETNLLDVSGFIGAGFDAELTEYEARNLVFVGGETSFIMVDVSSPNAPVVIDEYEGGGDYIKRSGDLVFVDGFADNILIYQVSGGDSGSGSGGGTDTGGGQSNAPSLSGDLLTMPVVTLFDQAFRLVFQVVSNGPNVDLVLTDFAEVTGVDTSGAPSFFGGLLSLPELVLDGASFWGEFVVISDNPVTFRLSGADVNKPGASGVEGRWRITETVNGEQCDEGTTTEVYQLQVAQQGNQLTVTAPVGTFNGVLNGTNLRWSGSFPEDGGTVSTSIDVTFTTTLDSLSGSSSWSWSDGSFTCAGTSQISGILLRN